MERAESIEYPLRVLAFARRDGSLDESLFAVPVPLFRGAEEEPIPWKPGKEECYILGCLLIVNVIVVSLKYTASLTWLTIL
jgi:hypothetical protein